MDINSLLQQPLKRACDRPLVTGVAKEAHFHAKNQNYTVKICNGQFQKISIHHDGRLQYFNPPCLRKFQNALPPPCPQNSIIVNPPLPLEISLFSSNPSELPNVFTKCPTWAILRQSVSHHSTFVGKNWKKKRFLLTFVQQLQSTEILHYTKLLQNIKIKILCDISLYTRKILRSKAIACSDTSAILNLSLQGQQSRPIQFLDGYISVFLCLSQSTKSSRRS